LFSNTSNYFRASHDTPNVKNAEDVLATDDPLVDDAQINCKSLLEREVHGFNKIKMHKMREAKLEIASNKKRLDLI
jgi:hypothetical protein